MTAARGCFTVGGHEKLGVCGHSPHTSNLVSSDRYAESRATDEQSSVGPAASDPHCRCYSYYRVRRVAFSIDSNVNNDLDKTILFKVSFEHLFIRISRVIRSDKDSQRVGGDNVGTSSTPHLAWSASTYNPPTRPQTQLVGGVE